MKADACCRFLAFRGDSRRGKEQVFMSNDKSEPKPAEVAIVAEDLELTPEEAATVKGGGGKGWIPKPQGGKGW